MGPYVQRVKAEWESELRTVLPFTNQRIRDVADRIRGDYGYIMDDLLHGGQWLSDGAMWYIACRHPRRSQQWDCHWRSISVPTNGGPHNAALDEWYMHRAEMALRDGVIT